MPANGPQHINATIARMSEISPFWLVPAGAAFPYGGGTWYWAAANGEAQFRQNAASVGFNWLHFGHGLVIKMKRTDSPA